MKKTKKNSDKFSYPHPILKSFTQINEQDQSTTTYAYQNVYTCTPGAISSKMLGLTHNQLLMGSTFSMVLHPLYPGLQINSYQKQYLLLCKKCKSYLNSTSMAKLSLLQHRCLICGFVDESEFGIGRYVDLNVVDSFDQSANMNQQRKFLFVIQANEHIYDKKIVKSIFQCLRALSSQYPDPQLNKSLSEQTQKSLQQLTTSPPPKIGFLLFDSNRHYILNMETKQLLVLNPSQFGRIQQFPLVQDQLLQPLNCINVDEIEEIIEMLMYQAYQLKYCCFMDTVKVCEMVVQAWNVQARMFVMSYDQSILKDLKNNKNNKQSRKALKLSINPQIQLQVFNYSLYRDLNLIGLNENLSKFHEYNSANSTDLYYSIYHTLTQQTYYNVTINIISSELVSSSQKSIKIPILTSNRPIMLDFNVLSTNKNNKQTTLQIQQMLKTQTMYIQINFGNFTRNIVKRLPKIGTNCMNEPYFLNDQVFFYAMVRKFLSDKNVSCLKKALYGKAKEIVKRVMQVEDSQFLLPRNLTNFFMYTFMLMQHGQLEKNNNLAIAERNGFFNQGLQTIVKKIYPKVYDFYPQIRPLKYRPKSFLHDTIRIVDNGKFLGLVIGDQVSHITLTNLLNVKIVDDALSYIQIPILQSKINEKLRECIQLLRNMNQLYYLPLKIFKFDSRQYEENYGNYLYIDDHHLQFFSKLFKD